MTGKIHPTAVIHETSRGKIAADAEIGPYAVIGEEVSVGPGTRIGPHAVVEFAQIGKNCKIFPHAFIGTEPQDLKYRGEKSRIVIGDQTIVREAVTLHRGTAATGVTRIGSRCLFMACSHVGHDCIVGDGVILANSVALAGHVEVGDHAVIGGMAGVHQFVRIGRLAMLGAGSMVPMDVPPFMQAQGDRARLVGINLVGLRRQKFDGKAIEEIRGAYRTLFSSGLTLAEALDQLGASQGFREVAELVDFIRKSKRGICRPRIAGERAEGEEGEV